MQKNVLSFKAAFFLALIFTSCSTTNNSANIAGWVGRYIYKEDPVEAVQGIYKTMNWELSINQQHDTCKGILEILGERTYVKALTTISGDSNAIDIIYDSLLDGADENFIAGETLFSLKKDSGKIVTAWSRLQPRLPEYFSEECACFRSVKKKIAKVKEPSE